MTKAEALSLADRAAHQARALPPLLVEAERIANTIRQYRAHLNAELQQRADLHRTLKAHVWGARGECVCVSW